MANIYNVNRSDLIAWINDLLSLNYSTVEDTGNGAAFCQVLDAIHPGTIKLKNVDFNACDQPSRLNNYKILQEGFDKNRIRQFIDADNLSKGKFMATLEMLQFLHQYYQNNAPQAEYDAVARRRQFKCKEPKGLSASSSNSRLLSQSPSGGKKSTPRVATASSPPKPSKNGLHSTKIFEPTKRKTQVTNADDVMKKEITELKKHIKELEEDVEQMNQERDFYYDKLRKVEEYCQDNEDIEELKPVLDILYEPDEEHGFLPPEEEED